jgi:hypothetical protein
MRECLHQASIEALDVLVERLNDIRMRYLPEERFIVELDEAQQAVKLYPRSFLCPTDSKVYRSILYQMVKVYAKLHLKLVVSGTGLPLGDLQDGVGLASGVSKPKLVVTLSHKLGMFDTWPKLKEYFERYVPASFWETSSGDCLQQRMREYLLGR